ncbi:DUF4265 domain-containing protein [Caenimonas koreensis]|uniref:DUF4265 domain-containing protein n=1 Tax=Caenimonas koreensis TaxID=367474 RepID=UPI0037848489
MNDASPSAKVLFRVPDEDGSAEVETLWAFELGSDRYRLDNLPFYAYGVSVADVVLAPFVVEEGFPTFQRVLEKSGNRTIRVIFEPPLAVGNQSRDLLDQLVALGVEYEGANSTYVVLNIPPKVDFQGVVTVLLDAHVQWEHADPTYDEVHADER